MLKYLIIGILTAFVLDLITEATNSEHRFNTPERIVIILLWPISIFVFVWEFLKAFFTKK